MKRLLLAAVLLLTTATLALAIPAKRFWRTVVQPDGTELKLMLIGDERLHYFITEDTVPVLEYKNAYYYADGIGFGMTRSNTLAHNAGQRTASEAKMARAVSAKRIEQLRPITMQKLFRPTRPLMRRADSNGPFYSSDHRSITGQHKSIVILCEFPNKKFAAGHDSTYYWNMVNEEGYTNEEGAIGSIHDYFKDQSHGLLDLTFDVVGPIEMDYNYSHYGSGMSLDTQTGDNGWEFAYEALNKVDSLYPNLNWADYDWDGDGEVENLYLIYAGYGQATGGSSSTLWPAQTNFDDYNSFAAYYGYPVYNVNFDGVKINTFAYGNELYGSSSYNSKPQGMGTMTHEFSHCLGFPDLYNTDYTSSADMGNWSILAAGSYGGPQGIGWVPVGYTAYEKWAAGWIDYKEFGAMNDTIDSMKSTYNGGNAYVIYNDRMLKNADPKKLEYFVLENRTQNRWDTYIPAQGLEVLHVNYDEDLWNNNNVNNGSNGHSNVVLVPADNSNSSYNERYDLWPYNKKDSITPNSTPKLNFYNNQLDGTKTFAKKIVQIKWHAADSTVSFIFNPVDTMLTPAPTVEAKPVAATANSGSTRYFADSTTVTLTASLGYIRYSTDSAKWKDYTEPFTIKDDSTTLYTYAWREAHDTSSVVKVLFVKQKRLDPPVISGDSVFVGSTKVTITADRGRVYYAVGNSTTRFRLYSVPITVSSTTTVRAFTRSTENAYLNSDTTVMSFRKMEVCAAPKISVSDDSTSIVITTNTDGGHIWFTTDTTKAFTEYDKPIDVTTVDDSITVWAYVSAEGKITSDTVSFTFVAPEKQPDAISAIIAGGLTGRISIYTVSGQPVATTDRIESVSLRPGLYIVRDEKGRTRKVTVK